jgi:hypothetical protein
MVTRTQMGANASIGLEMLGYNNVPNGANINAGISRWNGTEGEQQVAYGDGLPTQSTAAFSAPGKVDTTPPTITVAPSASGITQTSADISRTAAEPATMKVEYGTASGVYTDTVNNTVLNASKTVSLGGLSAGTTYYVKVTSYDGYANGAVSSEFSFTTETACTAGKPDLQLGAPSPYWASFADYTAHMLSVDWTVNNVGATDATNVQITGSTNSNGVTLSTSLPASVGDISGGGSGGVTLVYDVGHVGSWHTSTTASAEDCAANSYTYP